jgi:hypothetical protein
VFTCGELVDAESKGILNDHIMERGLRGWRNQYNYQKKGVKIKSMRLYDNDIIKCVINVMDSKTKSGYLFLTQHSQKGLEKETIKYCLADLISTHKREQSN